MAIKDLKALLYFIRAYFLCLLGLNGTVIFTSLKGLKICHTARDYFTLNEIFYDNKYNRFHPQKGWIIIDVGANIGAYTLLCSSRVGSEGLVIAVEPEPGNLRILSRNIRLNNACNVKVVPVAISDGVFYTTLYRSQKETVAHSLDKRRIMIGKLFSEPVTVKCISLDELMLMLKVDKVDLLKIDAEGEEEKILRGGKRMLNYVKHLIVEIHTETVNENSILSLIKKLRFNVCHIDRSNPVYPVVFAVKAKVDTR